MAAGVLPVAFFKTGDYSHGHIFLSNFDKIIIDEKNSDH